MQQPKKVTNCSEQGCFKKVDMIAALSTGLCDGCRNVFCYQHKFKHVCDQLLALQQKKKQELSNQLLNAKVKKTFSFF